MNDSNPLKEFVVAMTEAVGRTRDEAALVATVKSLLAKLISRDDWLPEACAAASKDNYQQYLLHCDPLERFSVVSFVWGPGQSTPVHDHTVWGVVGVLRGAEHSQRYARKDGAWVPLGAQALLKPGDIDAVSPTLGDAHRVGNALSSDASISIHVYGANIGAVHRHVFDVDTNQTRDFQSGYSSASTPNIWMPSVAQPAQ